MSNFLIAHWRPVVVLLAIVASFLGGRFSAPELPARVEYRERAEEAAREVKVTAQVKQLNRRREITRETKPDGSKLERVVETTAVETQRAETTTAAIDRTVSREVRVDSRPPWRVTALAGADLRTLSLTAPPAFEFGALVERRLVGPLSVGAYGMSSGRAGVALSVEF